MFPRGSGAAGFEAAPLGGLLHQLRASCHPTRGSAKS
jgi:hypothetical protein